MARQSKAGAEGQLPRNDAAETAELGVAHDHGTGDKNHIHRLGHLDHDHDDEGRPVFPDQTDQIPVVEAPPLPAGVTVTVTVPEPDPDAAGGFFDDPAVVTSAEAREHVSPQPPEDAAEPPAVVRRGPPTPEEVAEAKDIETWHPHIARTNGASNGPPGESIADVLTIDVENTIALPDPTDPVLAQERIYRQLAVNALLRVATYNAPRPKGPETVAPAEILLAARDAVEQMCANRNLLPTPDEVAAAREGDGS